MTYGLVMIVKNEGARIERCLASVRPYIGAWTIIDTGSTDGTRKLVAKALEGIPGKFRRRPWVDFGTNRSQALAHARGTADWLLTLDADMTVEIDPDFEPDPALDCYMIEMRDSGQSWRLPLLLRGDLPWASRGAVHEYTVRTDASAYIGRVTDKVRVTFPSTPASPTKRHWHAGMLEEELLVNPDNARAVFYLAQTYRELGDPRAIELYQRRMLMGGTPEEVFYATYRAALLEPDWPARALALMGAWEARPARLEPLHALVRELNAHGLHEAAYRLSRVPVEPPSDMLFVETYVWEYGMAFERSIAAWWAGPREEADTISDFLLADPKLPSDIRVQVERNRALPDRSA